MSDANVVVDTSDGFVDLALPVIESRFGEGGEASLRCGGLLLGLPAEIEIDVRAGMLPNDFSDENLVVSSLRDGIRVRLTGEGGRNFASQLCLLYGKARSSFHMPVELSFTGIALTGVPANIATEVVKFKLFHEEGSTDEDEGPDYFEMFLNVDTTTGTVEWKEKDTDYRSGVEKSFPAEPS
ncbi:MAG TPA: hypothetical protein VGN16_10390 [Acidobacteriaceae bacterium]|jgi:hypothetical protein